MIESCGLMIQPRKLRQVVRILGLEVRLNGHEI